MNTSEIISLKQELLTVEQNVNDFEKQKSAKKRNLITGIVGLIAAIFVLLINNGERNEVGLLSFVIGLTSIIFLVLGGLKNAGVKKRLKLAQKRMLAIKHQLVSLENER